ncbi:hypothetical protein AHiyo4_07410 [Arthrobacter sp. Hiyo4]|nr:hypothetical protein AHiyo4_07410 [Arthrobacter sp. Hiyo4]
MKGRRDDLLPPTSLRVGRGELLLVTAERQDQRTALALTISGRMKPTGGRMSWDANERTKSLRLSSALVDSPNVNEPEQHLSVRDLVTEDLALIPRRYRGALLSKPWLKVNSFEDIADLWTEQLAPDRRIELLTALALANPHTDLLVVDSPTGTVPTLRTGSRGWKSWRTTPAGRSPSSSPLLPSRQRGRDRPP